MQVKNLFSFTFFKCYHYNIYQIGLKIFTNSLSQPKNPVIIEMSIEVESQASVDGSIRPEYL
jgi:hypothetical protein